MNEIVITRKNGTVHTVLLDDEDYERFIDVRWCVRKGGNTFYAIRWSPGGNGNIIRLHREILGLVRGDGMMVDHINHNGLDNRRCNLRVVTNQENSRNRRINGNNKCGFKGVFAARQKWRALIYLDGKKVHIGYYPTAIEAAQAYDEAARKMFGSHACLNFHTIESIYHE